MSVNFLLVAALEYARRDWPVFPVWWPEGERCACGKADCQHPGKHPLWHSDDLPCGRNSATTELEAIKRWWQRWPRANIGISTGKESGLFVVDVDPRNGGHPDRLPDKLPLTPQANTGGNGWHYYLACPGDGYSFPKELPGCKGIDLKTAGGYVVAPPSMHISGERYSWKFPPESTPLAPCPAWLLEITRRPEPRPTPPIPAAKQNSIGSAYGRAALRAEITRLAQTPPGSRNIALNNAAYALGRLVAAGHLDEGTVVNLLSTVGASIGLGDREIRATLRSGLRAGLAEVAYV